MWCIDQSIGTWASERLQAQVSLTHPVAGLHQLRFVGAGIDDAHLMQVAVPLRTEREPQPIEDAYVRGSDLVVVYAETPRSPVRPTVYWRITDAPEDSPGVIVEAIVSMQTQQLAGNPRLQLATSWPGKDWHMAASLGPDCAFQPLVWDEPTRHPLSLAPRGMALLARWASVSYSYGQLVEGTDLLEAHLAWDDARNVTTLWTSHFGERLEKGVLRRVRSRALLVPRAGDETAVANLCVEALAAAPPLTT